MKHVFLISIGLIAIAGVVVGIARWPDFKPLNSEIVNPTISASPDINEPAGAYEYQSIPLSASISNFTHRNPGFSFQYPAALSIGVFGEDGGELVLAQAPSTGSAGSGQAGFQIFITVQDENFAITPERIRQDVPGTVVQNPRAIRVDGAPGLAFESASESLGPTYEVWFIRGGYLYQTTAYRSYRNELEKILGTWKFE